MWSLGSCKAGSCCGVGNPSADTVKIDPALFENAGKRGKENTAPDCCAPSSVSQVSRECREIRPAGLDSEATEPDALPSLLQAQSANRMVKDQQQQQHQHQYPQQQQEDEAAREAVEQVVSAFQRHGLLSLVQEGSCCLMKEQEKDEETTWRETEQLEAERQDIQLKEANYREILAQEFRDGLVHIQRVEQDWITNKEFCAIRIFRFTIHGMPHLVAVGHKKGIWQVTHNDAILETRSHETKPHKDADHEIAFEIPAGDGFLVHASLSIQWSRSSLRAAGWKYSLQVNDVSVPPCWKRRIHPILVKMGASGMVRDVIPPEVMC